MKKQTIVMLEHLIDDNDWAWYAVIKNTTPEKALKWYCKEQGLTPSKPYWDSHECLMQAVDARAYEITLTTIK